ncbi:MAG TPA: hypothetical protein VHT30_10895 [Acidimicrobiales bacterium]|jgi:hypothetical protein|nr:hypothetical protein [Acidimicrobiales bacterium]
MDFSGTTTTTVAAAIAADTVSRKDVVIAILGAQAAISALVLVFLGVLLGALGDFDAETPAAVLRPFRVVGGVVLAAFVVSVVSMGTCLWWLIGDQASGPYEAAIITLVLVLALLLATAGWIGWTFVVGR